MKTFRNVKFVQLGLSIGFDLTFFLILVLNEELRNTVFTNSSLTILCICTWVLSLATLAFLVFDIQKILELVVSNHELNKEAYLDNLTGIPNRHSLDTFFAAFADKNQFKNMGCGVVQLKNLNEINKEYGHAKGDEVIQEFSNIFETVGDRYGFVGRNGGNEYIALFENCTDEKMNKFFTDLKDSVGMYNRNKDNIPVILTCAYILNQKAAAKDMTELIGMTYRELRKANMNG